MPPEPDSDAGVLKSEEASKFGYTRMSAIGISHGPIVPIQERIISAHADHRRSDFVFARIQSPRFRDAPWDRRIKPQKSWSQIGAYGGGVVVAAALLAALF